VVLYLALGQLEPSKLADKENKSDKIRSFDLDGKASKEFDTYQRQLMVLDTKGNNLVFIASMLILATTLASIFNKDLSLLLRVVSGVSTVCVLASAGFCVKIIWTKWASDLIDVHKEAPDFSKVIKLRDDKTTYLKLALIALIASLVLFGLLIIFGLSEAWLASESRGLIDTN
jgi:hypothetical protein